MRLIIKDVKIVRGNSYFLCGIGLTYKQKKEAVTNLGLAQPLRILTNYETLEIKVLNLVGL